MTSAAFTATVTRSRNQVMVLGTIDYTEARRVAEAVLSQRGDSMHQFRGKIEVLSYDASYDTVPGGYLFHIEETDA